MQAKNITKQILVLARRSLHFRKEQLLLFTPACEAKKIQLLAEGTEEKLTVSAKEILAPLILSNHKEFAIIHSHTYNDVTPSFSDYQSTKKIALLSESLDLCFIDHLILTKKDYFSFRKHYPKIFRPFKITTHPEPY